MQIAVLTFKDATVALDCREVVGRERLGEPSEFTVEAFSTAPVDVASVVGQSVCIGLSNSHGERVIPGVVTAFTAIATSNPQAGRRYRLQIRSAIAVLELTRRSRIFQHESVPDIIVQVLQGGGFSASNIVVSVTEAHAPREYVVQYGESDASFVRRLCEEEGLYFRFEAKDGAERFLLEDTSSSAPAPLSRSLLVVDRASLEAPRETAFKPRATLRRRPGKVTLRDYNQENPAVKLEAVQSAGTAIEQGVEVYEAPGRFSDPGLGGTRAKRRLESLRTEGDVVFFETTAFALAPGTKVDLECAPELKSTAQPSGDHFVVGLRHRWSTSTELYELEVEAIPASVPFRLAWRAPRPRIAGVQQVFVTGAPGEEIHVDAQGRARVRFLWDRATSGDDKASLPIRVMQPNTPGSMLLPRVGWEMMAAFEDGDPDRPYLLGRTYNAKSPPPFGLPANKTVTALGTLSSPGGGKLNRIHFDDAAGKQNVTIAAGFGKSTTVANNMVTQTVKNEALSVNASQSRTVGATEDVSVTQAYLNELGSQSATVGGMQKIFVKGDQTVGVGSETVLVGGAVLEKVGNPVSGALNLAKAAAMAGAGALGTAGSVITKAVQLGQAGYQGYQKGGLAGAARAAGAAGANMAVNEALSGIPGASDLLGKIEESHPPPWAEKPSAPGPNSAGGGAGAASDAAAAGGPGPGYRNTSVTGPITELVGGAVAMITPGSVNWSTIGISTLLIGGSHSIKAGQAGAKTLGIGTDTLGSFKITVSGGITRDVKGPINTTIAGSLTSKAGGKHSIKAGAALTFKVGGPLKMTASKVSFIVGGSTVTVTPSGLLLDAGNVVVTGYTTQKKPSDHS